MVEYQTSSELFCFIASYHSLTSIQKGQELSDNILHTAADFLALGLDPEKSVFWVQSDVPEVTELAWLLSTHITVPQLELAHSFKDKVAQGLSASSGLFFYPVLMAADILLFAADRVPVGKDQKQHLEITRDIAQRFNQKYGEVLKLPEPDIQSEVATVPGVDGRKMSKSYNNAIYPFETEKKLRKSVMGITTDSTPVEEAKDPEGAILFELYCLFLNESEQEGLRKRFRTPGEGYGHIKQDLFLKIVDYFGEARLRRDAIMTHPEKIYTALALGAKKARTVAKPILKNVRKAVGLDY